jgi:hypothetical protein
MGELSVRQSVEFAERVKGQLASLGDFPHVEMQIHGRHLIISRAKETFARLTALGHDAFGLAFCDTTGGWEPMLCIDRLDEIVAGMTAALEA